MLKQVNFEVKYIWRIDSEKEKPMNEKELKEYCKLAVDHTRQNLSDTQKEFIKQAIEESKNMQELIAVAITKVFFHK